MPLLSVKDWSSTFIKIMMIGGGASGVLNCGGLLLLGRPFAEAVTTAVILAIYAGGLWAGLYPNAPRGGVLAKAFLLLQIPMIQSYGLSYEMWGLASYKAVVHLESKTFTGVWNISTWWAFAIRSPVSDTYVGANLLPIALLMLSRKAGPTELSKSGDIS